MKRKCDCCTCYWAGVVGRGLLAFCVGYITAEFIKWLL